MECYICTEVISSDEIIPLCGHTVHIKCIAITGKEECPFCKKTVIITDEYKDLLTESKIKNKKYIEKENLEAAILIEQEQEQNNNIPEERFIIIGTNSIFYRHRLIRDITYNIIFEELAKINYARNNERIVTDKIFIDIMSLVYHIKEMSIVHNMPISELLLDYSQISIRTFINIIHDLSIRSTITDANIYDIIFTLIE